MRVKEVCLLLVLLLTTIVYAAPNANISLTPIQIYETNEADFNLTINNLFGNEVIENIKLSIPTLEITEVETFLGWQNNYSTNEIIWYDGDIETNSITLFQFSAQAGLINNNQTIDVEITTNDNTVDTIQINLINDETGPILNNPIPEDNGFLRVNITNQTISVNASDLETGILNGTFSYWDCSTNASNVTIYSEDLICNDVCETTADLSYYEEGDEMCFEYIIYNNALESTTLNGSIGFDGTAPSVVLTSPDDNSIVDGIIPFIFNATDNLAPTLECNLLFENNIEDSTIANNNEVTTLNFDVSNLTEGTHLWKIICIDGVKLEGKSEERNVITGNAPITTLNITQVVRTKDYEFTAIITDETGIDNAYALFGNNSIALTQNGNEFTGTITTDLTNNLGNNQITIVAEDLWTFTSSTDFTFELIQGYIINLNVNSPTQPGDDVNITGTVTLDDGTDIPETNITIYIGNNTIQVPVINQSFNYLLEDVDEGNYDIIAEVISANGYEHQETIVLIVEEPASSSSSSRSSPSSGGLYCGDGRCTGAHGEDCDSCSADCGACPEEPKEESTPEEEPEEVQEADPRVPAGVGSATGFFGKVATNPLSWILFLIIMGMLYIAAFKPTLPKLPIAKKTKRSKVNWKGYFDH